MTKMVGGSEEISSLPPTILRRFKGGLLLIFFLVVEEQIPMDKIINTSFRQAPMYPKLVFDMPEKRLTCKVPCLSYPKIL